MWMQFLAKPSRAFSREVQSPFTICRSLTATPPAQGLPQKQLPQRQGEACWGSVVVMVVVLTVTLTHRKEDQKQTCVRSITGGCSSQLRSLDE